MPRSTTPRSRRRAGLGLAAVALLGLTTACGPKDEGFPAPLPSSAAPSTALPSMDLTPFTLDVPSLSLGLVPGATVAVDEGERPLHHGAWLEVPDAPVWTQAMSSRVKEQIAAYRRDTDVSADPRLDVQAQLAVVGPRIAAARLLTTQTRGSESVSAVETVWYSPADARVLAPADLFTAQGWDAFRAEVRDRMAGDPDIVQERLASAVASPDLAENRRVWDAVVLLPDGSALLEVDQAALAPAATGVLPTRIPAATVQPWLSELGRAAQEAARSPQALDLATDPTPSGSASTAPQEQSSSGDPASTAPQEPSSTGDPAQEPGASGSDPATSADPGTEGAPQPAASEHGGEATGGSEATDPGSTGPDAPAPGSTDPDPAVPAPAPAPDPESPAPSRSPRPSDAPGSPEPAPSTTAPAPRPTSPSSAPTTAPSRTPAPTSAAPTTPSAPEPTVPPADPTTVAPEPTSPAPSGSSATAAASGSQRVPGRPTAPGPGVSLPPQASGAPGQEGR